MDIESTSSFSREPFQELSVPLPLTIMLFAGDVPRGMILNITVLARSLLVPTPSIRLGPAFHVVNTVWLLV
jgi:hypothetical protein